MGRLRKRGDDTLEQWASLLGLAVLDSINPSALLVTLHLLGRPAPARTVPAYMAGVVVSYLIIGVLLVLGYGALKAAWTV